MTIPREDQKSDNLPNELLKGIKKSQIFRVTSALSSVGVMHHDIIKDLEYVDQLPSEQQNQAFTEFMSGIQKRVEEAKENSEDSEEEVYL